MAIAHSRESFYKLTQSFAHRKQILVEGDSWIGHPLPRASNLCVKLDTFLQGRCNLFSIGEVGHLASEMMSGSSLRFFTDVLKAKQFNFSLIFFSGGGNDILANNDPNLALDKLLVGQSQTIQTNPALYIDKNIWQSLLNSVLDAYRTLLKTTSQLQPECPVVTHTYDYIYPRNKGTDILFNNVLGPWVYPEMLKKGITNSQLQRDIIKFLLDDFAKELKTLGQQHANFHVVDTLGTLPTVTNWGLNIPYWDDEIHPDKDGFGLLVQQKIGPVVKKLI